MVFWPALANDFVAARKPRRPGWQAQVVRSRISNGGRLMRDALLMRPAGARQKQIGCVIQRRR